MRAIYLDTFAGISGNMLLGALIDAGFPLEILKKELRKLNIGDYKLLCHKVNKLGIEATYFNVLLSDEHVHHHEEHQHEHVHNHEHSHGHSEQHLHAHAHVQPHVHHHEHRNLHDIMHIINSSDLSDSIKTKAGAVFTAIAEAEAKVHGKTLEEVHFHEVGAIDTIIDIVGCLLGLEYLKINKVYVGKITTGFGFVECAHGLMPVPAPATAELLQGLPQQQGIVDKEMTTPTGAALAKVLAEAVEIIPENFVSEKIAYGAGTREVKIPNVLRMYFGYVCEQSEQVVEAACNIDDISGEILGYTIDRLLAAGALDAWAEPIVMKKNRPAYKLSFLADEKIFDTLAEIVFTETSTLGLRFSRLQRKVLQREFSDVETEFGSIKIKSAIYNDKVVHVAPEYESCKIVAEKVNLPLKKVMDVALRAVKDEK